MSHTHTHIKTQNSCHSHMNDMNFMNESCHTYNDMDDMNESCHTYMKERCHTYE